MSLTIPATAVTSGSTLTIPDDIASSLSTFDKIEKYNYMKVSVSSASSGVGTITADNGTGTYQSVDALTDDYGVYPIGGAVGVKIAASVADITVSVKFFNEGEEC